MESHLLRACTLVMTIKSQHSEKQHGITRQWYLQLNTTDNVKTTRILTKLHHKYTCLPERPYTALYSWWWVELSPETCRVKPLRRINAIVAFCWNYFTKKIQHVCHILFDTSDLRSGKEWCNIYYIFTLYNSWLWSTDCISCRSFIFEYMNVLLFVRKDTTFKLVCVKLHIQWFLHFKPYVNLFVVWPSDLHFITILIYLFTEKFYLFIYIYFSYSCICKGKCTFLLCLPPSDHLAVYYWQRIACL